MEGSGTGTDGLYFPNTATSLVNVFVDNNNIRGFRWDIRATNSAGLTLTSNHVVTQTGI